MESRDLTERYNFLKTGFDELKKQNVRDFLWKARSFLNALNKRMQRKGGKLYRGMFEEIAVLLVKAERRFGHKYRKSLTLVNCESAFRDNITVGVVVNHDHKELETFLKDAEHLVTRFLTTGKKALKVYCMLTSVFEVREELQTMYLYTRIEEIFKSTDLASWYAEKVVQTLLNRLSALELGPSNSALSEIVSLSIHRHSFQPAQIGRISSWIPTPKNFKGRKALVNIRNKDDFCFLHCINASVNPAKGHQNRVSSYSPLQELKLDLRGIDFPITLRDVPLFERKNQYSVNVFGAGEDGEVEMWHRTSKYRPGKHVNLFLLESGEKKHFTLITNTSRLFARQLGFKKWHKYHCDSCLLFFKSEMRYQRHRDNCLQVNKCAVKFPEDDYISFNNINRQIRNPFVIYVDCESLLVPSRGGELSGTIQKHRLFSVGMYVHSDHPDLVDSAYEFRRGPDAGDWFMKRLIHYATTIDHIVRYTNEKMVANTREKLKFIIADKCYLCGGPFTRENYKVADHDHLSKRYRGAAHTECNLLVRKNYTIPCVMHNFFGYDVHLLIEFMAKHLPKRMRVIAKTSENYVSISLYVPKTRVRLLFLDSYKFLQGSLSGLADLLPDQDKQLIRDLYPENHQLLLKKLCFPYEYVTDWDVLEQRELPAAEKFFSQLSGGHIAPEEYEHTKQVWNTFGVTSLGELADLYLKIDVLLLTCVFEKFRAQCLKTHHLDPTHYFTLPSLSWDAMLRYTRVRLKIIKDVEVHTFLERGLRGGFSCAIRKFVRANNKFVADYNSEIPTTYIMYYDVNNLYGGIMEKSFPYRGFRWVKHPANFDVFKHKDRQIGYILEVDVHIPPNLHHYFSDLPPLLTHEDFGSGAKLVGTLYPKEKYVVHGDMLKFVVGLGVVVTKVHRVLRFYQKPILRKYMRLNSRLRRQATNAFERNQYKLMNNSIFGKTLQNNRKHQNISLATQWKKAQRLIAKPNFHRATIFNENLAAIHMKKTSVTLNQPIYIGFTVLELAKQMVWDFHYNFMKKHLNASLCYTDTDSLIYEVEHPDVYTFMKNNISHFDTSNFAEDNPHGVPRANASIVLKMKDEAAGVPIAEFVALGAKQYTFRTVEDEVVKKAKGVKKNVVKRSITFEDYKKALFHQSVERRDQTTIQSKNHHLYTLKRRKIALRSADDKRVEIEDYRTLPHGHVDLNN